MSNQLDFVAVVSNGVRVIMNIFLLSFAQLFGHHERISSQDNWHRFLPVIKVERPHCAQNVHQSGEEMWPKQMPKDRKSRWLETEIRVWNLLCFASKKNTSRNAALYSSIYSASPPVPRRPYEWATACQLLLNAIDSKRWIRFSDPERLRNRDGLFALRWVRSFHCPHHCPGRFCFITVVLIFVISTLWDFENGVIIMFVKNLRLGIRVIIPRSIWYFSPSQTQ
jgi:hypothetical protein